MLTLALTGDVMLGRLVDQYVLRDRTLDPGRVWGNTIALLLQGNLRLVNLECVISSRCEEWRRAPKAFNFCANPRAIGALRAACVDFVALANNHVLDYGVEPLLEMMNLLDEAGIAWAGAGRNLDEAMRPALLAARGLTIAVVSITDNERCWEAGPGRPGVAYVDYDVKGLTDAYRDRLRRALQEARARADLVLVTGHVGPNWGEPSPAMQALAHQLIDLGADLYWGHSNHTTRGIEVYGGKPILYSTGDFVDDYAVDPDERNDLSFLFRVIVDEKRIQRLLLYPVKVGYLQVNLAEGAEAAWVRNWMRARSVPFGTRLEEAHGALRLDLAA